MLVSVVRFGFSIIILVHFVCILLFKYLLIINKSVIADLFALNSTHRKQCDPYQSINT